MFKGMIGYVGICLFFLIRLVACVKETGKMTTCEKQEECMVLSSMEKEKLISDGYVVIQNLISDARLDKVTSFVDEAYSNGKYITRQQDALPSFLDSIQKDNIITDLVWKTDVITVLEKLYGDGQVEILGEAGQIAFRPGLDKAGVKRTGWHVDEGPRGKYVNGPASFSLLVGVVLSSGQEVDADRGQLNVWTGM